MRTRVVQHDRELLGPVAGNTTAAASEDEEADVHNGAKITERDPWVGDPPSTSDNAALAFFGGWIRLLANEAPLARALGLRGLRCFLEGGAEQVGSSIA